MTIFTTFLVFLIGFAAGFIDAIVGGGGLIATPAMLNLFPQFSILQVIATNRTSSIVGTSTAAWNYFRTVKLPSAMLISACVSACFCSYIGAELASHIDAKLLKTIVLCVIVLIVIYSFFKKELGQTEDLRYPEPRLPYIAAAVGGACGFYNGLIGPGTGTLLVFAFVSIVGLDFLKASAISKVTNVSGDISSWLLLLSKGYVFWPAAIPLVFGNVLGSYAGSRLAILKGSVFIRTVFIVVVFALVFKVGYDVFGLEIRAFLFGNK
jgi:uncharacterized protein